MKDHHHLREQFDTDGYVVSYTAQGNDCEMPPPPE